MDLVTVRVGIDVGQKIDPTAIVVAEVEARHRPGAPEPDAHYVARHVERLPLGTPYPAVAARLAAVVRGIEDRLPRRRRHGWVEGFGEGWIDEPVPLDLVVSVDATGVGQPVVDVLAEVLAGTGVRVVPVYFTHGDRRTEGDGQVTLGKAWLVSRLKSLLQQGRVHLPLTPESIAMQRELLDYELRVAEDANDKYGAFKVGAHDDLVTALGLAVQGGTGGGLGAAAAEVLAQAMRWQTPR